MSWAQENTQKTAAETLLLLLLMKPSLRKRRLGQGLGGVGWNWEESPLGLFEGRGGLPSFVVFV